ncbi:MAG: sugar transferase [Bowdeniella nasicola]|nr:sugar transferase [Bowdeniella nasicola]
MSSDAAITRIRDAVLSAGGLIMTSPVMALAAAAIIYETGRPVFFRQTRIGKGGEPFTIHKFRTMRLHHDGITVSPSHDPRVTRTGAVLRKTKIDELPQLFDVLRGKMALVGPRPEVPEWVEKWPAHLRDIVLSVRPGITDPVSIELRNEAKLLAEAPDPKAFYEFELLPRKVAGYARYVQTRTFVSDLKIIIATLRAIVREDDDER